MIRLLGFLVGSAIAVGAILLLLGVPDLRVAEPEVVHMIVADSTPAPELANAKPPGELPQEQPAPELLHTMPPAELLQDQPAPDTADEPDSEIVLLPDEMKWYSFWNPFRSAIAANGFVGQGFIR